jgi:calcium/calmodulin-dependent protein kinase (CaM kinase) II
MKSLQATESELLDATRRLLDAIAAQDWATYESLCDPSLTCFEPEARGQLVEGLPFHRFYFHRPGDGAPRHTTICSPHVRVIGDSAVVCYSRLTQTTDAAGQSVTYATQETRIWQRQAGGWRLVHFHRSSP